MRYFVVLLCLALGCLACDSGDEKRMDIPSASDTSDMADFPDGSADIDVLDSTTLDAGKETADHHIPSPGTVLGYDSYDFELRGLTGSLPDLVQAYLSGGLAEAEAYAANHNIQVVDGAIQLIIDIGRSGRNGALAPEDLVELGAKEVNSNLAYGWYIVPLAGLSEVVFDGEITDLNTVWIPQTPGFEPIDLIELAFDPHWGMWSTGLDLCHNKGIDGDGVHVMVLDVGFAKYPDAVMEGVLPQGTKFLFDVPDLPSQWWFSPHGTAVAEIVHRAAPGAKITLARVGNAEVALPAAVQWAMDNDVNIINNSWAMFGKSFYDGTGPVADAARSAWEAGIVWVCSAGNYAGGNVWQGKWQDDDDNGVLEFGDADEANTVTMLEGQNVDLNLTWDAWSGNDVDLDLCYRMVAYPQFMPEVTWTVEKCSGYNLDNDPSDKLTMGLHNEKYCHKDALKYPCYQPDFDVYVIVAPNSPTVPMEGLRIHLLATGLYKDQGLSEFQPDRSVLDSGSTPEVITVGAIHSDGWAQGIPAGYSSYGPTNAGTQKPEISGPAGVESYIYEPFAGTSASTPFVSGAAALLLQETPDATPDEIKTFFMNTAEGVEGELADRKIGFGKLHYNCGDCIPKCQGKECGDDQCGGECGLCDENYTCKDGVCTCLSACEPDVCGDDGCGGQCSCNAGFYCGAAGICQQCTCQAKECGEDECGNDCGDCGNGLDCAMNVCVESSFVVNTTADDPPDGCTPAHCTLREAIEAADSAGGKDIISFGIPGDGPFVIQPESPLPPITDSVVIDATTQPGWEDSPFIQLDGLEAGAEADGLLVQAVNVTIRGLAVTGFDGGGINIEQSEDVVVEDCHLGVGPFGMIPQPNSKGIRIWQSDEVTIGSETQGSGNVISGNTYDGIDVYASSGEYTNDLTIVGNLIGVGIDGSTAVPNGGAGIDACCYLVQVRIGGTKPGAKNVVSGNVWGGIHIGGEFVYVEGNYIGTDASASTCVPNGQWGISYDADQGRIGGDGLESGNVIACNDDDGILVGSGAEFGTIASNLIGTNPAGDAGLGNGKYGLKLEGASDFVIGGDAPGSRNVVAGNGYGGIALVPNEGGMFSSSPERVEVLGNYVGVGPDGESCLSNDGRGIYIKKLTEGEIGGATQGEGNLIACNNGDGIRIRGYEDTSIQGNVIGKLPGKFPGDEGLEGNQGAGINVDVTSGLWFGALLIGGKGAGQGNFISGNEGAGILVFDPMGRAEIQPDQVSILANSISDNGGLGIALGGNGVDDNDALDTDFGANGSQNYPAITGALYNEDTHILTVVGDLASKPETVYRVEFFVNSVCDDSGHGEGHHYIGYTKFKTDADGKGDFSEDFLEPDLEADSFVVTATATDDETGDTSEFSACMEPGCLPECGGKECGDNGCGGECGQCDEFSVCNAGVCVCLPVCAPGDCGSNGCGGKCACPEGHFCGAGQLCQQCTCQGKECGVDECGNECGDCAPGLVCLSNQCEELTFVVNTVADSPNDGCTKAHCTLREAIELADANGGMDVISFDIPGDGPFLIQPQSSLPPITDSVVLDATTQPGWADSPFIQLDGLKAGTEADGLLVQAVDVNIRGLAVTGFDGGGINIEQSQEVVVDDCHLGVGPFGMIPQPNARGIRIWQSDEVTVGSETPGKGNVISGNTFDGIDVYAPQLEPTTDLTIVGNLIGVGIDGSTPVPNGGAGIDACCVLEQVRIGGTMPGAGNVVSGNAWGGIHVGGDFAYVEGNMVGTDAAGLKCIPNGKFGIRFDAYKGRIGGDGPESANVIACNDGSGIEVGTQAEFSKIASNFIGTNWGGDDDLGNGGWGIRLEGAKDFVIGGDVPASRNVVVSNASGGIAIVKQDVDVFASSPERVEVLGNYVGADPAGASCLPNDGTGIFIERLKEGKVGGGAEGEGNLVACNDGTGIRVRGSNDTSVQGNIIGKLPGDGGLQGNAGYGIYMDGNAGSALVTLLLGGKGTGQGNSILGNGKAGIAVHDPTVAAQSQPDQVSMFGNSIYDNGGLGIELGESGVEANDILDEDPGANGLQNYPELAGAEYSEATDILTVTGTLVSKPETVYRVEFFISGKCDDSGHGEGEQYIGYTKFKTDIAGHGDFDEDFLLNETEAKQFLVTATATDDVTGDTSEFSACAFAGCIPACKGKECGDDGCGGTCGECVPPDVCIAGTCVCEPNCVAKWCGDDGCGGSCPPGCADNEVCHKGTCLCVPDCEDKICGDNGCGGSCGECGPQHECNEGQCICVPDCEGKECGDDGCGDECAACVDGFACLEGVCAKSAECDDGNEVDWDGCTGGFYSEVQVNSYAAGDQRAPDVATLSNGRYVVVWESEGQDGDGYGLFGRLFGGDAQPWGDEFAVNSFSTGQQLEPVVAGLGDGRFVVAWAGYGMTMASHRMLARVFEADGSPATEEVPVDLGDMSNHKQAAITPLGTEGFVVAWSADQPQADGDVGIYARAFSFDPAGEPETAALTNDILVNSYVPGNQQRPSISAMSDSSFVVAWESCPLQAQDVPQDGDDCGAYSRWFAANGSPKTDHDVQLNTVIADDQWRAHVATRGAGKSVALWQSGPQWGQVIQARFQQGDGSDQGDVFQISDPAAFVGTTPDVAGLSDGRFVAVWEQIGGFQGLARDIAVRAFDAAGSPIENIVRANEFLTDTQKFPAVAIYPDGGFAVAWESCPDMGDAQDGEGCGIYTRTFDASGKPVQKGN